MTLLLLDVAIVVLLLVAVLGARRRRRPVEYVVLVRSDAPTPSETVTPWNAYEAAPQIARTPAEAIAFFRRDSGLTGPMIAVPTSVWRP